MVYKFPLKRASNGPDPSSDYFGKHKKMMDKLGSLPEGWQEKWDPGTGRHFYWCTRTDKVSWLPPGHPKGTCHKLSVDFWSIFSPLSVNFWSNFSPFSIHFRSILSLLSCQFWYIFNQIWYIFGRFLFAFWSNVGPILLLFHSIFSQFQVQF